MSISGVSLSSHSQLANGPSTLLQANSPSSSTLSSQQQQNNETVYHVRNSSTATSARAGGTNLPAVAAAASGGGKRVVFVRLTDAAIQQFEKLALDAEKQNRKSSIKTQQQHAKPTISCFRRKTTNGMERSEGEITLPPTNDDSTAVIADSTKLVFSITSANANCDSRNPRSSFECVKLRRRKSSSAAVNTGDGSHLGFFRHQFQVRTSEAESFSSTKRKLQEVKLEDAKSSTKGLTSLPEQAGRRTAVVASSQSSSNLSSLLANSKKVKSHNQLGTIKPVASATRLAPPAVSSAQCKKSPGMNALSPLVSASSPSSRQQNVPKLQPLHAAAKAQPQPQLLSNSSPVIQPKSVSSPMLASSSATTAPKPISKPLSSASTFMPENKSSQKPTAVVVAAAVKSVSSGSPPATAAVPPPLPHAIQSKPSAAVAAGADKKNTIVGPGAAVAASIGKQPAAVQPPITSAILAASNNTKTGSPDSGVTTTAAGGGGIGLLRNSVPKTQNSMPSSQQQRFPNNEDSTTSPKGNLASNAGQNNKFLAATSFASSDYSSSASTAGLYGGNSGEHYTSSSIDSRPESAYSSGNESTSSTGVGSSALMYTNTLNSSQHQPSSQHSSGPGSASSTSSSSSTNANSSQINSHDDSHEKSVAWSRTVRVCETFADRQRLTEIYAVDWHRYGRLRQYILHVRNKFDGLKVELDKSKRGGLQYVEQAERIRREYALEMRDGNYKAKRSQYEQLRAHLRRISTLIQHYDEKREIQVKNRLAEMGRGADDEVTMVHGGFRDVEMLSSGNVISKAAFIELSTKRTVDMLIECINPRPKMMPGVVFANKRQF